jgi:RNase H-fold protein (predicted Holliday junction resolvase)
MAQFPSMKGLRELIAHCPYYRIAALDVGMSKIGVAIANPGNRSCVPLTVLVRHQSLHSSGRLKLGQRFDHVVKDLHKIIDEYDVGIVVVGLPIYKGQLTSTSHSIHKFTTHLLRAQVEKPGTFNSKFSGVKLDVYPPLESKAQFVYWNER